MSLDSVCPPYGVGVNKITLRSSRDLATGDMALPIGYSF